MHIGVLVSSTPFVLLIVFLFAAACWGLGMLLARDHMEGPLGSWPVRWFSLLDALAVAAYIVIVVALSFSCSFASRGSLHCPDLMPPADCYNEIRTPHHVHGRFTPRLCSAA